MHYLSGHSPSTFVAYLDKINKEFYADTQIQQLLWQVFKNPASNKFQLLLDSFSEVEKSIVCLLALGLTVSEVSGYKGISEVRIRHVIQVIRYNECWEELYGQELHKLQRRKEE